MGVKNNIIVEYLLEQLMWQGYSSKSVSAKTYYELLKKLEDLRRLFGITKPSFRFTANSTIQSKS